jgi:hypothetical protein
MVYAITSANNAAPRPANDRGIKVKEPDRFTGKDPAKLRSFIMSCELVFQGNPRTYQNDLAKITYAVAYLSESAQLWYEPYFANPPAELPDFCQNWLAFREELKAQFGNPHEERDAIRELMKLKMAEGHKVSRYVIDFNNLATRTFWGDEALTSHFYEGLPDRIKDQLASVADGPPTDLNELRRLAQNFDALYWSRQAEKKSTASSSRTQTSTVNPNQARPSSSNNNSKFSSSSSSNNTNANRQQQTRPSAAPRTNKPDLTGKLTSGNKLTDEERQNRMANNLCLYCGKGGHKAIDCRLAAANKPGRGVQIPNVKGRAATVEEVPDEAASAADEGN